MDYFKQLGRNKVFLRSGQIAFLDAHRAEVLDNAASRIQNYFRTYITHKEYVRMKQVAVTLQAFYRGMCSFCFFLLCNLLILVVS